MIRFGTPENDLIVETQENDIIWGLAGADIIASNAGNDQLYGNQGNDVMLGGTGADRIWGGKDDDLIVGNPQEDYVNGNLGNDTVHGGQGDDCVRGGQGNDWVSGDRGNDILYGDLGDDTLVGGPGQDIFVLGSGEDVIVDFTPGQDRVGLASGVTFDSLLVSQRGEDSVVSDRSTGAIIGIFQGIDATTLEASQFTNTLLNIPTPSPLPSVPDIPSSSPSPAPSLSILPPAAEVTAIETDPGNTLETASSISLASNTRTFSQSVGGSDVADYYKFSLGATNTFELSLTGLTALATVDVLDEEGNVVLNGQLNNNTSVISGELPGGAYRLRITSDAPTNYLLNTRIVPQLPGITTDVSDFIAESDTNESLPLISVDTFKADQRFDSVDGSGYAVVILDSGINEAHPAFENRIKFTHDYVNNKSNEAIDDNGHGSHVSSIVASSDSRFLGVAPGADIIHLKVLNNKGKGSSYDIQQALQWIVDNADKYNIAAVNMSLGYGNYSSPESNGPFSDELRDLAAKNIIVVSSSGNNFWSNESVPGVKYPSADPNSLSVGAVFDNSYTEFRTFADLNDDGEVTFDEVASINRNTRPDDITAFSQRHPTLTTVFAPGARIHGADATGTGFNEKSGTSQAAPHVAGMAVLAQQLAMEKLGRKLTPAEFETWIKNTGYSVTDGDTEDDNVTNTNTVYIRADMFGLAEAVLQLPTELPIPGSLQANPDILDDLMATVTGTSGDDTLASQANENNTVPITINTADILANDLPNDNLVVHSVGNPFGYSVSLADDTITFIPNSLNPASFQYTTRNTITNQTSNLASVILHFALNLNGLGGNDLLVGGVFGRDTIQGGDGNDTIFAGVDFNGIDYSHQTSMDGSDTVVGGRDDDSIWGGNGDDYLDVDASLVNSIIPASDDAVQGNDTIDGGFGNDTIGRLGASVGATGVDYYDGREGNDSILGGNQGSNAIGDTLIGGDGNDTIRGGTDDSGRDSIVGGNGNDSLIGGNESSDGDTLDGGNGNDNIDGQDGNDYLSGGIGEDSIVGSGGSDTMLGGDQNDTLLGGDGNDSIFGGNGQDTIEGGVGSDTLSGFNGSSGGDGTDRFVFNFAELLGPGNTEIPFPPTSPFASFGPRLGNLPASVSPSNADFITDFDPNQDVVEIGSQVYPIIDNLVDPNPINTTFGGQLNLSSPGVNVGRLNLTGVTGGTLLYIERNKISGFTDGSDGDIAVATFLGLNPGDFTASNFIGPAGPAIGGPVLTITGQKISP